MRRWDLVASGSAKFWEIGQGALSVLAEASHRGLDHLTDSLLARVREVAAHLHRTGLRTAAAQVTAFADAPAATTWLSAHFRLLVTADAR